MPFSFVMAFDPGSKIFLYYVHGHRRKKLPVRKYIQPIPVATNTGPFLSITVPWRDILITDRPVYTVAISQICLKVQVTEPIALSPPHQRTSSHMVPTVPVKSLDFDIGTFFLVDPKIQVLFI